MATYNGAKYILEQLQSFTDQSRQPDELIITDDCSTDETEAIILEFAKTAPFKVKFFRNEKNLGYCGNFNAALTKTTGDLVFLSDQDDVWLPEKVEHIVGVAERNPEALVVMNDAALTDGDLNEVGLTKIGQIRSAGISMDGFVMGCCCLVRRELLDLCLPIPVGIKGHDNWLVLFADGLKARIIDGSVLQYYRRHETNESQFIANRTTKVTRIQLLINSVKKVFEKDAGRQLKDHYKQMEIIIDNVHEVSLKSPQNYRYQLAQLESQLQQRLILAKRRIIVREKFIFSRVPAAIILYIRGDYNEASGLKSLIRDIVG